MTQRIDRRTLLASAGWIGAAGMGAVTAAEDANAGGAVPLAQDYTVVFHNPDRELYVEGCGLAKLPDGALVAVVPVVPRSATGGWQARPSTTHIVRSTDGGESWQPSAQLPFYSAVPWLHQGSLYLFAIKAGTRYRNDDLLLLRSGDGGKTWSEPVTLFEGHFWNCHTGMVRRDNRLYWAFCDIPSRLQHGPPQRRPRVIAGELSKDPMDPRCWRLSEPASFPEVPQTLMNPEIGARSHALEPNVIEVCGKIRVISCVKPAGQSTAGLAAVYDLDDDLERLGLTFTQYHPRPGGQLKFCIVWDEVSKMFWSTANLVVDSQSTFPWWSGGQSGGNDRRFLMLFYGLDGLNWFQAGCVAMGKQIEQSFMYATPVVDGNDLAIISRSNVNGPNRHDADCATFHRVCRFRRLALPLVPTDKS